MVAAPHVRGKIYRFKAASACPALYAETRPKIPRRVRRHLVLALDVAGDKQDQVRVMSIATALPPLGTGTYLPIAPTPKKPFPMQLKLRNNYADDGRLLIARLGPRSSYLRVDESWVVHVGVLEAVLDGVGDGMQVWARKKGGMGELRSWLSGWQRGRERETVVVEEGKGGGGGGGGDGDSGVGTEGCGGDVLSEEAGDGHVKLAGERKEDIWPKLLFIVLVMYLFWGSW